MGTGWRRAFCAAPNRDADPIKGSDFVGGGTATACASPRIGKRLGFFSVGSHSSPSTPRLRCRTGSADALSSNGSPKLQCNDAATTPKKTAAASTVFPCSRSNSSSPRSPLKLLFLKNSFKFRSMCGVCFNSVKTGRGTAVYTAECGHSFHFPCVSSHVRGKGGLVCPVCDAAWQEVPLLGGIHRKAEDSCEVEDKKMVETSPSPPLVKQVKSYAEPWSPHLTSPSLYGDDEPLVSPKTCCARFAAIPEADEDTGQRGDNGNDEEFRGFFVNAKSSSSSEYWDELGTVEMDSRQLEVKLMPESSLISVGPTHATYAIGLRVKAPPPTSSMQRSAQVPVLDPSRRAPIDLVAALDVGGSMSGAKMQMMKRAMRLVVCSLGPADRLSLVSFSSGPRRLLPLTRMTVQGQRTARRIIDGLSCSRGGGGSIEALRHATKVLEDRRERNPVASIVMLSNSHSDGVYHGAENQMPPEPRQVSSTRFAHAEIPVESSGFRKKAGIRDDPSEDAFTKCLGGLLSVVVQDLNIKLGFSETSDVAEIAATYSCGNGRPTLLGSDLIRIGNLYAGEERELLVEVRVPATTAVSHHVMTVQCRYRDPVTKEAVGEPERTTLVPRLHGARSSDPRIERLRNLFVTTRAVAEARRLVDFRDYASAYQMLTTARAMVMQSRSTATTEEFGRELEAELWEVNRSRQRAAEMQQGIAIQRLGREGDGGDVEPMTPSSAWRAAGRVADSAGFRKEPGSGPDPGRVGRRLHGF
ncbi:hypothetical protein MLD38_000982 [Melastoma candidum]|uniref:Uncharacterized protein n=1 Tax=Melastoma candidum TaxID=119954 RepID=A0ACB9SC82_9MYRT|nr:hypothetical protein MLD38_000982 [Melastoma candidum]